MSGGNSESTPVKAGGPGRVPGKPGSRGVRVPPSAPSPEALMEDARLSSDGRKRRFNSPPGGSFLSSSRGRARGVCNREGRVRPPGRELDNWLWPCFRKARGSIVSTAAHGGYAPSRTGFDPPSTRLGGVMAAAPVSKSGGRKTVRVRLPLQAQTKRKGPCSIPNT